MNQPIKRKGPGFFRRLGALFVPSLAYSASTGWPVQGSPQSSVVSLPGPTAEGYPRISAPGTRWSGGIITGEEPNPELQGEKWQRNARFMPREDPMIQLCVEGYQQTIRSANWKWAAGDESPRALFLRDFFEDMWSRMRYSWKDRQVGYMSRFALTGFRYAEQIDDVKLGIDGQWRTMVDFFADCEPFSHYLWISLDGGRTLYAVEQIDQSAYPGTRLITEDGDAYATSLPRTPADRLLLLTHGFTGQNWEGDGGLLRAVWGAFNDKKNAQNIQAVALDRFGSPTPHVITDDVRMREAGYTQDQINRARAAAEQSAKNWAAGENTYISTHAGIRVEFIGGDFDASNFNATIQQRNDEAAAGLLQTFVTMGLGDSSGSRALSTQSAAHFNSWCVNVLDDMAAEINGEARPGGGIVGRIMRANGWTDPVEMWPRIEHSGLKADDFTELAGVISAWKSVGLLTHKSLIRTLNRRMDLGMSEKEIDRLSKDRSDGHENVSVQSRREGPEDGISPNGQPGTGRPPLEGGAEDPEPNKKPRIEPA